MPSCSRIILALTALLAWTSGATAATVLKVDVAEMTSLSKWVVQAHVESTEVVDRRAEGESIFTDVTLSVDTLFRGPHAPEQLTIRLIGGAGADGITVSVPGMPGFDVGEEVVVFLEETPAGLVLCGLGQGVFRVHRDERGVAYVAQDGRDLHVMARGPSGALRPAPAPLMTRLQSLDELAAEIAASLPEGASEDGAAGQRDDGLVRD